MKLAKNPSDIPEEHHYAIIVFKTHSVYVPGDERSRTNPGHGYPGGTDTFNTNEYNYTTDRDEWIKEIKKLEQFDRLLPSERTRYAAIEVAAKASVKVEVVVGVKTG